MYRYLTWFALAALPWLPTTALAGIEVVYPRNGAGVDPISRNDSYGYPVRLLSLCLEKSGEDFVLRPTDLVMNQERIILQMKHGLGIDIWWMMTSKEREAVLMPVRIPIDRGAAGWRIFLIREGDQAKFDKVKTVDDLRRHVAVQGTGWPDADVLVTNALPLVTSVYPSNVLEAAGADYYPRSITEAWVDAKQSTSKRAKLVVEKRIALHYVAPTYFFVNKQNTRLADLIRSGCEEAIKDGSFRRLFDQFNQKDIHDSDLSGRRIFRLQNPVLPSETPVAKKEYWLLHDDTRLGGEGASGVGSVPGPGAHRR
jgi:hypothetical protein